MPAWWSEDSSNREQEPRTSRSSIDIVVLKTGSDGLGSVGFTVCLSKPRMPIRVKVSHISIVLTYLSKILELESEGRQLTSSTQGFIRSSHIMSKPKTSKQHF